MIMERRFVLNQNEDQTLGSGLINLFSLVSQRRVDEKRNVRFGLQKRRGAGLWKTAAQFPVGLPGYLRQPMVSQQTNAHPAAELYLNQLINGPLINPGGTLTSTINCDMY